MTNKYEIMIILDPKAEQKVLNDIMDKAFGKDVKSLEKMDRTKLAYEINKSTTAQYFLALVETEGENIKEFNRIVNITKPVWRALAINLTKEKFDKRAETSNASIERQAKRVEERRALRDKEFKKRNFDRSSYKPRSNDNKEK